MLVANETQVKFMIDTFFKFMNFLIDLDFRANYSKKKVKKYYKEVKKEVIQSSKEYEKVKPIIIDTIDLTIKRLLEVDKNEYEDELRDTIDSFADHLSYLYGYKDALFVHLSKSKQ